MARALNYKRGKGSKAYLAERPFGYVYGLRAKDSDQYFYIGSTTRPDFSCRLFGHFRPDNRNKQIKYKLEAIGRENVVIELIEQTATKERFKREYALIAEYKTKGHPLLNMVLTDEPPIWIRTPNKDLRDFVTLLEHCHYNDSWVSYVIGWQVRHVKRHYAEPSSDIGIEPYDRLHALPDPPEQRMPTAEEVTKSYLDLFRAGKYKQGFKLFQATCTILNLKPRDEGIPYVAA